MLGGNEGYKADYVRTVTMEAFPTRLVTDLSPLYQLIRAKAMPLVPSGTVILQ